MAVAMMVLSWKRSAHTHTRFPLVVDAGDI
jgi:hypothetical protein